MLQTRERAPRVNSSAKVRSSAEPDRYAPASRLILVRSALQAPGGVTLSELMERLGVERTTVWRYLRALANAGTPIFEEKEGRSKRFRLHESARHEVVRLSQAQIVALFLTRRAMGFLRGTGFDDDLDDVLEKLAATLKRRDAAEARHLDRKLFDVNEEAQTYARRSDHVSALVTGLLKEERLEVKHHAVEKGRRALVVEPYTLLLYKKGLYLVAKSHHHNAVRTFGLDGFRAITWKRGDHFPYPARYHPSQRLRGAFGITKGDGEPRLVRVRFEASVARFVTRRKWHASQKFVKRGDGAIEMHLRVSPSFEVRNWVLRVRSMATVIEPEGLRKEIAAECAAMNARYNIELKSDALDERLCVDSAGLENPR
jgi:predicted DNA-binding transcriptional regulator YafY